MIILYKSLGETPYQAILALKEKKPELKEKKLSYAGRLDPMAEGLLLILVDDENKNRRSLEHLDKTYEFEAILGISSDSYDLLGLASISRNEVFENEKINEFIKKNKGKIIQEYPPYSSIKVEGKPLYWWTRNKKSVIAPKKEVLVKDFKLLGEHFLGKKDLEKIINDRIPAIVGDFRQEEILAKWKEIFEEVEADNKFCVLKFRMKCTGGGYVRSIVNELGKFLGVGAVAMSIKRVEVGEFGLEDAIHI